MAAENPTFWDTEGYATTIAAQADSPAAYFSFTPFVVFSPE